MAERIDLHAHTTISDGQYSPEQVADFAERRRIHIAITDHLRIDAHRIIRSPYIIPGIEVKAEPRGVDIVVCFDTPEQLERFYEDVIVPANPTNTMYGSTQLHVLDLLQHVSAYDGHAIAPHYATPEGIGVLDEELQQEIARTGIFIELNGRVGRNNNSIAKRFAREQGNLPTIAGSDSHLTTHYGKTYTAVRLPKGMVPTVSTLLAAIRRRRGVRHRVDHPSFVDTLRTIGQSAKSMLRRGGDGMLTFVKNFLRNRTGRLPSALRV